MAPDEPVHDFVVAGAGLAGLAAAVELGERCVVLEAAGEPGGLVRSVRIGDYWFDRVLHMLYLPDEETRARLWPLIGDALAPCTPQSFVNVGGRLARYPLQMHLADLGPQIAQRCVRDLLAAQESTALPRTFDETLAATFGEAFADIFLRPYNAKMWARPLSSLAPDALQWTTTRPDIEQVLKGASGGESGHVAYNAQGYYPRPPAGAPLRGMGVISAALAGAVHDLRLEHRIVRIDPQARCVIARTPQGERRFPYRYGCILTQPLPVIAAMVDGLPAEIAAAAQRLSWNRVYSVALCVRGPRPAPRGQWRYYADEKLCFTRLVDMTAFDPLAAPPDGYGLLAEITQAAEEPEHDHGALIARVIVDARASGDLGQHDTIIAARCWIADPAYVVFAGDTRGNAGRIGQSLRAQDLHVVGRYGRWEYSSMGQVMRDGLALGCHLAEQAR
jgi:protoporphyrinogen oxidase